MKIVLLLLLFTLGLSTPCFAQKCIPDVIKVVSNDDHGTDYIMVSGAVFHELPIEFDEKNSTADDIFVPWMGSGDPIWICGDHALLHVQNLQDLCRVGVECKSGFEYTLIPVECKRRCLR